MAKKSFKVVMVMRRGVLRGLSNLSVASETGNAQYTSTATAVGFIFLPPPSTLSPVTGRARISLSFAALVHRTRVELVRKQLSYLAMWCS